MQRENHPLIMGVLNVTPDSFSDGGKFFSLDTALAQAEKMLNEGADIIDVGGESTRPGSVRVSVQQELDRVIPVVEKIAKNLNVRISIDTTKFEVAEAALANGATLINDISGGRDIRMPSLLRDSKVSYILMHMQGTPETMQEKPAYLNGVVTEVEKYLQNRVRLFQEAGAKLSQLWVDPGIGFGKTVDHNLDLLRHISVFKNIGAKLVIGTSRKSFIAKICVEEDERLSGTLASNLWAYSQGASVFRVHNVLQMKNSVKLWEAIQNGSF